MVPLMKLDLVRHAWGSECSLPELIRHAKSEGYAAVEAGLGHLDAEARQAVAEALAETGLGLVVQVFSGGFAAGPQRTPEADLASLRQQIADALPLKPRLINAHSGFDAWTRDEMRGFYREVAALERDLPVPVAHETHRGRCFHSAWIVRDLLADLPAIRFTADYSHWCCVAERLITDQEDFLRAFAQQVIHLHARVGHGQGPQVPDPRDPAWAAEVAAHEHWWDLVWDAQAAAGHVVTTLTPEFGPFPYLPQVPYTTTAVADLEEIIRWQADRQKARFAARSLTDFLDRK